MTQLAKNLKKRAKELVLTDAEIARRTGLPVRRYGHYATGYREPNLDALMVICDALDTVRSCYSWDTPFFDYSFSLSAS